MIRRAIHDQIQTKIVARSKAVIVYGPRQVGKTTLINTILESSKLRVLRLDAQQPPANALLSDRNLPKLQSLLSDYDCIFIDEAQYIPDIGLCLKLIIDHIPTIQVVATGSSSFELAQKVSEPLTGRKWTYTLLPVSIGELIQEQTNYEVLSQLEDRLRWGSYPYLFQLTSDQEKTQYLQELTHDYLYRDIVQIASIKHSDKIHKLLRLLAYQIGQEVSLSELGVQLEMGHPTVASYIELLEKSFVLYRLSGFSSNLRKEVSKMDKYYFYDVGVRNMLIEDVRPLDQRNDIGQLWENFIVIERQKRNIYQHALSSAFFWRVYTGGEVDYVERDSAGLHGYEIKYSPKSVTPPPTWTTQYPDATFSVIHKENFLDFV